ncbi:phospholipase [Algimonas ampicilliniresistens]|uniref:Phospholipase n=1 Tax=Algimonas ampicilliniresistens TaxID=1298735 RepID=A0ABQ5V8S4_9PROT|nr:patatin-like phospholipase family protein [Algimonas ampicilliniresistens]GLQ23258.1 phospholipase [Algimonas ampicilliniresistens]
MRLDSATIGTGKRPPIGLALGGGVARGWAHIGALRALIEADIEPDIIAGTSIGSVVGAAYLAGRLDSLEKWARSLDRRRVIHYMDLSWGGSGLMKGARLVKVLEHYLKGVNIEDFDRRFAAVTCDLRTGYEVWLQQGPVIPAIRASYALPGAFEPVMVDNRYMIDGALVNPVPVSACRALGAHMVIAVSLNGDAFGPIGSSHEVNFDTNEIVEPDLPEIAIMAHQSINKLRPDSILLKSLLGGTKPGKGPRIGSVMMGSLNIVMDRISRSRLAGDPPDVFVAPRIGHIGMLEFTRADELIERGYRAMQHEIPLIRSVLDIIGDMPSATAAGATKGPEEE